MMNILVNFADSTHRTVNVQSVRAAEKWGIPCATMRQGYLVVALISLQEYKRSEPQQPTRKLGLESDVDALRRNTRQDKSSTQDTCLHNPNQASPPVGVSERSYRNSDRGKSKGVRHLCADLGPEWHDTRRGLQPWVTYTGRGANMSETFDRGIRW